ncbi:MAG: hypothetical protein R2813_02960 [Flavobacteriales bacterium]
MGSQQNFNSKLPSWLTLVIAGLFVGHFAILTLYHFSFEILPRKYGYFPAFYVKPWFGQNFMVFAPEPMNVRCVFLYRLHEPSGWTRWKYPIYPHLQNQWKYRFHPSVKMADQLERMALNFLETERYFVSQELDSKPRWLSTPTMKSAQAFIRLTNDVSSVDSFQVVIYLGMKEVVGNQITVTDSMIVIPKYAWE